MRFENDEARIAYNLIGDVAREWCADVEPLTSAGDVVTGAEIHAPDDMVWMRGREPVLYVPRLSAETANRASYVMAHGLTGAYVAGNGRTDDDNNCEACTL